MSTLTLAMKTPASMTALMCFSQPEFSRPSRKSDMEGDRSSHTATTTQLHHRPEATSLHGNSTKFNFTAQTFISILTRNLCLNLDQNRLYGATPGDSCWDLVQFVTQLHLPSVACEQATNLATKRPNETCQYCHQIKLPQR